MGWHPHCAGAMISIVTNKFCMLGLSNGKDKIVNSKITGVQHILSVRKTLFPHFSLFLLLGGFPVTRNFYVYRTSVLTDFQIKNSLFLRKKS